jgi:hypothetical protein
MKQFLRKITLEQVINNAQILLSSVAKTAEMEEIEGKVDCATRIVRHKLTVYKDWFIFSQLIMYAI